MRTVSGQKGTDATVWKVRELARRTGLSARTLHYYDEIGLLAPGRFLPQSAKLTHLEVRECDE